MDCVFCKIVNGELEVSTIYEDEDTLAFLDIHPINPGHTLVIPKKHSENLYDIPLSDLQKVTKLTQELAIKIKKVLNAEGISIFQMNEKGGNQSVFHYHNHIVPRHAGDWLNEELKDVDQRQLATNPTRAELNSLAEKIKNR